MFLKHKLKAISRDNKQKPGWPGAERVQRLVNTANSLFIWAATACRFIREGQSTKERLCLLLKGSDAPTTSEEHLNRIYTTVLRNSV
jgi:hypothetical protein